MGRDRIGPSTFPPLHKRIKPPNLCMYPKTPEGCVRFILPGYSVSLPPSLFLLRKPIMPFVKRDWAKLPMESCLLKSHIITDWKGDSLQPRLSVFGFGSVSSLLGSKDLLLTPVLVLRALLCPWGSHLLRESNSPFQAWLWRLFLVPLLGSCCSAGGSGPKGLGTTGWSQLDLTPWTLCIHTEEM